MANKTAEEILESLLRPNADDETPEGDIRNYRTLVLHDSEFQPRIDEASRQLYEATMLILDTTMKPSAEREELARRYSAFYGITETKEGK